MRRKTTGAMLIACGLIGLYLIEMPDWSFLIVSSVAVILGVIELIVKNDDDE